MARSRPCRKAATFASRMHSCDRHKNNLLFSGSHLACLTVEVDCDGICAADEEAYTLPGFGTYLPEVRAANDATSPGSATTRITFQRRRCASRIASSVTSTVPRRDAEPWGTPTRGYTEFHRGKCNSSAVITTRCRNHSCGGTASFKPIIWVSGSLCLERWQCLSPLHMRILRSVPNLPQGTSLTKGRPAPGRFVDA